VLIAIVALVAPVIALVVVVVFVFVVAKRVNAWRLANARGAAESSTR
jgi:uncharacterized membrane protein